MARNSETLASKPFAITWLLNTNFRVRIRLPGVAWWKGQTGLREAGCQYRMLRVEQDLPQSSQEENLLRVDARSHTQGECRAYSPGTHTRKDEDRLLLEFPCNPTRTHTV
jgi:hypothetical protein